MAKSRQRSAAQRREQARQQRQLRMSSSQGGRSNNIRRKTSRNYSWMFIGGIVVMVALVIGGFVLLKQWQNASLMAGSDQAEQTIKTVNTGILSTIGPGSAKSTLQPISDTPLKGPSGKPAVLYVGGEYCPYCAAQRWGIVNSLSRFGQFGPLEPVVSSEQNVPTFSFHNIKYTSQYIDFVAFEAQDNSTPPKPLDTVPTQYQQIMAKYGQQTGGGIPFLSIANQQVSAGAYYQPDVLVGHSYENINEQLKDPNTDIARGVFGTANILTAAICTALKNQPASVCNDPTIQQIQKTPKASLAPGGQLASAGAQLQDILPAQMGRRDLFAL
ncbi:MAG: DUF929 family protein [Ktedonobacteraceae bacterium]|nr:DUF929 family protein [Ktedonobacteraceae bacterium]